MEYSCAMGVTFTENINAKKLRPLISMYMNIVTVMNQMTQWQQKKLGTFDLSQMIFFFLTHFMKEREIKEPMGPIFCHYSYVLGELLKSYFSFDLTV